MDAVNPDDGVHVIGHYYEPVNRDVCIMRRNHFHFRGRNDSRIRKNNLPTGHMTKRAFLVFCANGDEVPPVRGIVPIQQASRFHAIPILKQGHELDGTAGGTLKQ